MVFPVIGGDGKPTGYEIDNSARFGGVETFLTKSQSDSESDTDRRKFTVSGWYKQTLQGSAGGWNGLWSAMADSNNFTSLKINADKNLIFDLKISGTNKSFTCDGVFRDPSAWYHIVVAYDSTDGTAANRLKIYVNGEQRTGTFSADLSQNVSAHWGDDASAARVGAYGNNTGNAYMHNGYMADVCMTVGYALAPTAFGKTDDNGVWIPKKPSVTYSANGFFLEFKQTGTSQNSSGIGADTSGNDNHFAIDSDNTQLDSTTDTPTNNFCTLNPLDNYYASSTFSEGNVKMVSASTGSGTSTNAFKTSTFGLTNGKWYWEAKLSNATDYDQIGISQIVASSTSDHLGNSSSAYSIRADSGNFMNNNSASSYGVSFTTNDIISVALDLDNNLIYFYKNGTVMNSGTGKSISAGTYFPSFGKQDPAAVTWEVNFGNPSFSISSGNADANGHGNFEYAPPSGYYACCTKNLAEYG
jgi:hypothetical protein